MHELERISLDAYLPIYGPGAIDVAGATCLRAPHAPDSPMVNRVVGLGVDGPVDEARLDDVLDFIEAAAERLVIYRIKEPTSASRALTDVIVQQSQAIDLAVKCLRTMDPAFHEHAVEVNRLENSADRLLRESLAALFEESADPIEVIKWKEIYETLETVTDRCEDVVNVIEGIILKMA